MPLFETAYDLTNGADTIRRRKHGVIKVVDGRLEAVHLKPLPSMISQLRVWRDSLKRGGSGDKDICFLYYDQIARMPNFLVLKYVVSQPGTTYRTFRMATLVLDEIARIKRSDAVVCEVSNSKISDRLLERWGWESHVPNSRKRHFIKRFYGTYPKTPLTPNCSYGIDATGISNVAIPLPSATQST